MPTTARLAGVVALGLLGTLLEGCVTGSGEPPRETGAGSTQPLSEPLYRHTFTTPRGGIWDFQLGGGYSSDR